MPRLIELNTPERMAHNLGEDIFRIGRQPDNNLPVQDALVSRYHAEIQKVNGQYRVMDKSSLNGVYVNHLKIENEEALSHGDVIQVGGVTLFFEDLESVSPEKEEAGEKAKAVPVEEGPSSRLVGKEIVKSLDSPDSGYEVDVLLSLEEDRRKLRELKEKSGAPARLESFFVIYQVARSLHEMSTLSGLLERTIKLIVQFMDADHGVIFLFDDKGELRDEVSESTREELLPDIAAIKSVALRAIEQRSSILCSEACYMTEDDEEPPDDGALSAICVPIWNRENILGAICIDNHEDNNAFIEQDVEQLSAIGNLLALRMEQERMVGKMKENAVFRASLERFHSPEVVDLIMRESGEGEMAKDYLKEREVSILFADIVDSTSLIERLDTEEAADLLNSYFEEMTTVIFKYGGTVDKFMGDGIMANFGAPISHGNDAELAVFAAIEMMQRMEWFKAMRKEKEKFNIRIGVNTGIVITGYIGSKKRVEYSVLGDPVNIAARLQVMAQPGTILIGEDTYAKVQGLFQVKDRGSTILKGKKKETRIYEVFVD